MLVDLGLVDFDLNVPQSCLATYPLPPFLHYPSYSGADSGGTLKIQGNQTQSRSRWDTLHINTPLSLKVQKFVESIFVLHGT